jgi:hypothetical protein
MDFVVRRPKFSEGFETMMGGNLWPLILNDQPQFERGSTSMVLLHRRDRAAEDVHNCSPPVSFDANDELEHGWTVGNPGERQPFIQNRWPH